MVKVNWNGTSVDGDGELLAEKVSGADLRPLTDVPKADRVGSRAEVKCASVEDAVDRSDDWPVVASDRGQREQAHTGEAGGNLIGAQPPLGRVDAQQVPARRRIAALKQLVQRGDVGG